MRTVLEVATESTCQKRTVVCELIDAAGTRVAIESNRCNPPSGVCLRLGLISKREDYPAHSECNWVHAEIMALRAATGKPFSAIIYGHSFPCAVCESALRDAGVCHIETRQIAGIGLHCGRATRKESTMTDLELLLRGSLQISSMQAAIKAALPLMRAERDACSNAAAYAKKHASHPTTAIKLQADADAWSQAIAGLETALEPPIPHPARCSRCRHVMEAR